MKKLSLTLLLALISFNSFSSTLIVEVPDYYAYKNENEETTPVIYATISDDKNNVYYIITELEDLENLEISNYKNKLGEDGQEIVATYKDVTLSEHYNLTNNNLLKETLHFNNYKKFSLILERRLNPCQVVTVDGIRTIECRTN